MAERTAVSEAEKRVTYPGYNAFRPFVIEELERRKSNIPTPVVSPFSRMTACTQDLENNRRFFTLGLHGFTNDDYNMFDLSYGTESEIVGYSYSIGPSGSAKQLHPAHMMSAEMLPPGFTAEFDTATVNTINKQRETFQDNQTVAFLNNSHPIPGITGINVSRKGPFAPFIAVVKWQCYNRAQLEFLRHHFMNIGQHVVVEWGNQYSDLQPVKVLDFTSDSILDHLTKSVTGGRTYIIDEWVKPNKGNYDFIVGTVGQFTIDMDPKTGIYMCTSTIVGIGELIYGINNTFTFIDTDSASDGSTQKISTIADFFSVGKSFDALVNGTDDPSKVSKFTSDWGADVENINRSQSDLADKFSNNPEDYRFVSWDFFTSELLPAIFGLIDADLTDDINDWFDFSHENAEDGLDRTVWVGYNDALRSTDPDSLVIASKGLKFALSSFLTNGVFGAHEGSDGHRGKLNQGVWLNTGMIRRSFLESTDFVSAFRKVLSSMNNATMGFWGLSLVWDDEINKWRVVDNKFSDPGAVPNYYTFNKIKENQSSDGELLGIRMESAFPPELITQTMMYSKYKSSSPEEQKRLIDKYPKIGSTSTFIFSLNWTNLTDVLASALEKQSPKGSNTEVNTVTPETQQNAARANLGGSGPTSRGLNSAAGSANTQHGKAIGNEVVAHDENLNENTSNFTPTRNSVDPVNPKIDENNKPIDLITEGGDGSGPTPNAYAVNSLRLLQPRFRRSIKALEKSMNDMGYEMHVTSATRNRAYQLNLQLKKYPTAKEANLSKHLSGQAIDINFRDMSTGAIIPMASNRPMWLKLKGLVDEINRTIVSEQPTHYARLKLIDDPREYHHIEDESLRADPIKDEEFLSGKDNTTNVTPSKWNPLNYLTRRDKKTDTELGSKTEAETLYDERAENVRTRFGDSFVVMIELDPSSMMARIAKSGYENPTLPNGYVTGFPTTTAVEVEIVGMSGISISDIFTVEKLPYIFDQYGVFQITEVSEQISTNGWITKIRGYFKLIWLRGR